MVKIKGRRRAAKPKNNSIPFPRGMAGVKTTFREEVGS
jgi:hypothetical protein